MGNLQAARTHNSVFFSRLVTNTKVRLFQIRGSEHDEKNRTCHRPAKTRCRSKG